MTPWIPGERLTDRQPSSALAGPVVGVLALQGDVLEHLRALQRVGVHAIRIRNEADLVQVDGLVVPGGESTTIGLLLERTGLLAPVRERVAAGLPTFGTCAGLILLSDELADAATQPLIGGLHVRTRRNAFGRQRESFDTQVEVAGIGPMDASFIRAPVVTAVLAEDVEVLGEVDGAAVVVRQGPILAAAFHPEVTGDDRLHRLFADIVAAAAGSLAPSSTAERPIPS